MAEAPAIARPAAKFGPGGLLLLAGLSLVWGVNWPAMKIVLAELPLLTFRLLCLSVAGPVLLGLAALAGERVRVPRRELAPLAFAAFFNITCWHIFTAVGILLMEPGRASIIAFTMP